MDSEAPQDQPSPDGQPDVVPIMPNPEGVPDDTTQGLGGTAIEQTASQLEPGGDPSIDPLTGQKKPQEEEPASRIKDEGLAREMADIEDYGHTRAAGLRRDVEAEKGFKDTLHSIVTDPRYLDERRRHKALIFLQEHTGGSVRGDGSRDRGYIWGHQQPKLVSDWALEELHKLEATAGTENEDVKTGNQYRPRESARDIWKGEYDPEEPFRENELERARRFDEAADRDGAWVKLLHDQPVSEEYRAAHPEFGFGAKEMIQLEGLVEAREGLEGRERYLREGEFDDPDNFSIVRVTTSLQDAVEALIETPGDDVEGLLTEYVYLARDGSTTLNDLIELDKKLRERHNAIIKGRATDRIQVLEDVKSGQASHPPEPMEGQEAA